MVHVMKGVLIECDPQMKQFLLFLDESNALGTKFIIQDLDATHLFVSADIIETLKNPMSKQHRSQYRVLDEAARNRRMRQQLEQLERDNFHDDPHANLVMHKKAPKFEDSAQIKTNTSSSRRHHHRPKVVSFSALLEEDMKGRDVNYASAVAPSPDNVLVNSKILFKVPRRHFSANSILIHKYKQIVHLYSNGIPQTLKPQLSELASQVLREVSLSEEKKAKYQFFPVYGSNVYNIGSVYLGKYVLVGLPFYFSYDKIEDIDTSKINVLNQSIKWSSSAGQQLLDSLLLSENAKKFAIARDIYFCDSFRVHLKSAIISFTVLLPHLIYYAFYHYARLKSKSMFRRRLVYFCSLFIAYVFYNIATDTLTHRYEEIADRKAVLTKESQYYDGAVEFYQKKLQENRAYRKLLGDKGPKWFTESGEEIHYFRRFHLKNKKRLALIEELKNPS
ncbi:transmembrane protein-like protein [Dinothrombium tinctorium]|uniref:Transmembrane protein-like protein n=1 Tax=Dinothrombium tinctorium TaxID=1965070 RepID=A0A3S3NL85_9ACAR|nr:transmembrane protein-like protein [Dinothrombium tinctorium]